jgi:hypothetical protein
MKKCSSCKTVKPLSEFYHRREPNRKDQLQSECKECNKARRSKWWKSEEGKKSSANTKLKRRFGLTLVQYEQKVVDVGGNCEICGATKSYNGHRLAIDHDHDTGDFRGILCKSCNLGIAAFQDNVSLMEKAIAYLMRSYDKSVNITKTTD